MAKLSAETLLSINQNTNRSEMSLKVAEYLENTYLILTASNMALNFGTIMILKKVSRES